MGEAAAPDAGNAVVDELTALAEAVNVWPAILGAVMLFSVAPQLLFELVLLLYPKDHPRRAEHRAELCRAPRHQRPFWVAETAVAVLFEAVPMRMVASRAGQIERKCVRNGTRVSPSRWVDYGILLMFVSLGPALLLIIDPNNLLWSIVGMAFLALSSAAMLRGYLLKMRMLDVQEKRW